MGNNPKVEKRNLVWKVPRPTSLRDFFQIARKKLKISDEADVRVFSALDDQRYLITFPHRFALPQHSVMIERGRYPAFAEVFLMTTIIHSDNSTEQYLPVIVQNSKSVKFLKQRILKIFGLEPADYKKYVCYNITTGTDKKDKCWRDQLTLNAHAVNPRNGDRVGLQIGVDTINKKVCIVKDTRNLSEPWNATSSSTDASMTASGQGLNPYISSDLGTISIAGDATYDDLRKQIHGMQQIKNDVPSYKHLLLSWLDFVYQIPLSFPMLKSGKLAGQKNFNSATKKLCVEVLDEEMDGVDKNCRCLHIHLAKIAKLDDKPIAIEEEESAKNKVSEWKDGNYAMSYWPCDHHLRVLYSENSKEDKVTHGQLSAFLSAKYDIALENVLIAMFRINKAEWVLIDDSCDDQQNGKGLAGKPFHITKTNRHGQIFAIFDLSKCEIEGTNEEKAEFIKQSLKHLGVPPLSPLSKFHFERCNQKHVSMNDHSRNINNHSRSYKHAQLTISGVD